MNLKNFYNQIKSIYEETTANGGDTVASHDKMIADVKLINLTENDDSDYEIVGIEPNRLWGCGCWSGAYIEIRKKQNDK